MGLFRSSDGRPGYLPSFSKLNPRHGRGRTDSPDWGVGAPPTTLTTSDQRVSYRGRAFRTPSFERDYEPSRVPQSRHIGDSVDSLPPSAKSCQRCAGISPVRVRHMASPVWSTGVGITTVRWETSTLEMPIPDPPRIGSSSPRASARPPARCARPAGPHGGTRRRPGRHRRSDRRAGGDSPPLPSCRSRH